MSSGDLNTYGGKKKNFSFQQNLLLINGAIQAAVQTGATEATLQLVLTALQNGQDYEAKLVKDSDTPAVNWLEVRIYNPQTTSFDPPVYYLAGSNVVGLPVLPVVYIDPTTLLATIAANTTGLATQTTAASNLANTTAIAAVNFATEATLSGIKTQTDLLNFIATALEVTVTGAMPLPAGAATEVTLAALLVELMLKADLTETQPVSQAGVSRIPSVVVSIANASTVVGKQSVSLWFRGSGGTLGGDAVPGGARFTFEAKLGDTVGAIAYTVPTGGAGEVIITYLT